ncbi:GGDEF domain-containing protein [Thiotrichales bacterium 19S9-12]|nr:GGDEF domain-containing protein [Thiotrichales bacterium 19S9-11]MCF6811728.1 GGDEF domain-containing protein [Thiotrichales bacterium 19S9-12]
MLQTNVLYNAFVLIGLISLIIGQTNIFYLVTKQAVRKFQWFILFFLVFIFIIGYALFIIIMSQIDYTNMTKLVSVIFLGGGIFVMLVTNLSKKTIHSITVLEKLKMLNKELKYLSEHDDLTGLYRKNFFETSVEKALLDTKQNQTKYSILFMDLNHFKQVNDTYGHFAGDLVLKAITDLFKQLFRKTDIIARIGGDEFAVLLSNTDQEDALKISNKLIDSVKNLKIDFEGHQISIALSVGITEISTNHETKADIIKQADAACYQAKKNSNVCVLNLASR